MLSWNASSGLPEEHPPGLRFEHEFRFHDVSMHLVGLNPLKRKVRNLTARFNANTPLRPHLHIPRRSVYQGGAVADGKTTDVPIQTLLESPQFKHGRKGNDMNCMLVLVFYMPIQAFTPITTNTSQNGGEVAGFSWCTCLV